MFLMNMNRKTLNNFEGCLLGGAVGLIEPSDRVFDTACQIAAITHGHPTGYLAAGCLAQIIGEIMSGHDLLTATSAARRTLEDRKNHNECTRALVKAQDAWKHKPVSF
ncbi:MAG: ADP-ribosylglycohydrolase family protein [Deltaproteobacteria bacterium]|nr:ADP-ribosylglycohydrolase family protein [Deltaproteobacteria bacterium]